MGIDVAKDRLDVAVVPSGERWESGNDETGIEELLAQVDGLKSQRWQLQLDLDYARGQLRDLAHLKDKAEKAEITLAQIGGPLGLYIRCIHCSHEWREHQWKGLNRSGIVYLTR